MSRAGYCKECGHNVWLTEEGGCSNGHPSASITTTWDAARLVPASGKAPASTGKIVGIIAAVLFVMFAIASVNSANRTASDAPTQPAGDSASTQQQAVESPAPSKPQEVFTQKNWAELVSDPDARKGAKVSIVGQVFVAPEKDENGVYWQMWADPKSSNWNTLVTYAHPDFEVDEQDFVKVVGEVEGQYEGTNLMGADVTAVKVTARDVKIVSAVAAAPQPRRTRNVNVAREQHGLTIVLRKIEFADRETRVHVTVKNGTGTKATFYSFNAKATQGSKQFDAGYGGDYPEVSSELLPGVKSSGVIVFPRMNPNKTTRLHFEGGSDDWEVEFEPYVFTVTPKKK